MPSQIKWLRLFPSSEDLPRKVFRTRAASAFLSISPQVGNLNSARRSHPFREADRRSHRLQLDRQNRGHPPSPRLRRTSQPLLQVRRRASSCRSWRRRQGSACVPLAIFPTQAGGSRYTTPMIAVTFALPAESSEFLRQLGNKSRTNRNGIRIVRGTIGHRSIE